MRFFIAGIMQGSHPGMLLHGQDYRTEVAELIRRYYPTSEIYDPRAEHQDSPQYDDSQGRAVFLGHNRMCAEVDVVVAYVPEASMGTAIEIWEAFRNDRVVVTVSPLDKNWAIRFLSHLIVPDIAALAAALADGTFQRVVENQGR